MLAVGLPELFSSAGAYYQYSSNKWRVLQHRLIEMKEGKKYVSKEGRFPREATSSAAVWTECKDHSATHFTGNPLKAAPRHRPYTILVTSCFPQVLCHICSVSFRVSSGLMLILTARSNRIFKWPWKACPEPLGSSRGSSNICKVCCTATAITKCTVP